MKVPFSQASIKTLLLKNCFVRSATWEGRATEKGEITEELLDFYGELSRAGLGIIITGHAYVREDGKATPRQLGIYSNSLVSGLKRLVDVVHQHGSRIFIQLSHSGIYGRKRLSGCEPVNFSAINRKEVEALVEAFVNASLRAKEAGFDGIQLHAAHGYLISQSFSPIFNHRKDEFGGDVNGRVKFAVSIVRKMRNALGEDFPVLIKMNCQDFSDGGLSLDDSIKMAKILVDTGIDAIEISGGLLTSRDMGPCRTSKGPYFMEQALAFRKELDIPLMLVGGIRSYETAEMIVKKGIDFVSMSRPIICEPYLIKRWELGDRKESLCISDNLCLGAVKKKKGIVCFRKVTHDI